LRNYGVSRLRTRNGISFCISLFLLCTLVPNFIIPAQASDPQEIWALIVGGSMGMSFSNNAQYMYHVLNHSDHYNLGEDHIYYLDVDTSLPGVDALSNETNVRSAITNWLNNTSSVNDIIFIYFSSHGGGYHTNDGWGSGRIEFGGDEGNEVNETNFRMLGLNCDNLIGTSPVDLGPWPLNTLIDYDGDGNIDDRIRDFDHDLFIEVDINDDNSTNPEWKYNYWVDLDGDGNRDDVFLDAFSNDTCDIFIDAVPNWVIDGTDTNNDGLIIGVDLNGDGDRNDWVGIDECMQVQDGLYWDDELADDLSYLADNDKYAKLIFVRQGCVEGNLSCFGGGLIDDISAAYRIIMSACNETSYSYGDTDGDGYSEWSGAFINALHGEKTHYDPAATPPVVHDEIPVDADTNNDGNVSMWEAWNYAWNNDPERLNGKETPWLDDNDNHSPNFSLERDWPDPSDDLFSMETYFGFEELVTPDVNDDRKVNILDQVKVACKFGAEKGDPHPPPYYDRFYDLNGDDKINILDLVVCAGAFGKRWGSGGGTLGGGTTGEGTELSVYPSQVTLHKYESFSVNITIANVIDMYGWEFKLYWNSTLLNCTNAQIHAPEIWGDNTFTAGLGIENGYNATHGRYWKALSAIYPMPSFNGSTITVTLTFQALATGTSTLTLQDTIISDINGAEITHTTADGSVTVSPRLRYMRGDTHTINGLNAYKLGTTQSSIAKSTSQIQQEYGLPAYWGIKVWKRSTGGTETSLTPDIVAQVSRTSQGQGIQLATWSCPLTSINTTDAIVVRVYQKIGDSAWQLAGTFTTEQLGATQLDNSQWQIYYYTKLQWIFLPRQGIENTIAYFYWGTTTYNSNINNFEHN
jgi:hypothetical protein